MTSNINTYINKNDHSIKVCLNTNLDINEVEKKINQIESNIYLDRLKQEYKEYQKANKIFHGVEHLKHKIRYQAMRLFCLDCELVSFNDIEVMENEVNSQVIQDGIDVDSWSK